MNINAIGTEVLRAMAIERVGTNSELIATEGRRIQTDPQLAQELQRRIKEAAQKFMMQQAMAARRR